jgi:two-component system, cell cycle response regulator DivK
MPRIVQFERLDRQVGEEWPMVGSDPPAQLGSVGTTRSLPTVLLVESAQDNRAMYAEYLRASGFHAIEISNTAGALVLAVTADVIVTGILVDGPFDGVELVRRLKADDRTMHKPVIVLTGCAFDRDEQRARAAGCDAFLVKPCLPSLLVAELGRVLAGRLPCPQSRRQTTSQDRENIAS